VSGSQLPLVALTGPSRRAGATWPAAVRDEPVDLFFSAYARAVAAAGGLPVLVPRAAPPEELTARVDAVVLAGGEDLDPQGYDGVPHPEATGHDPERDAHELALLRWARRRGLPVLGICRGAQLIAVASGGRLVPHLEGPLGQVHTAIHVPARSAEAPRHRITTNPGSLVRELMGPSSMVNSLHHQAVEAVGTGFRISARADDGTVEAIESTDGSVLGVQWHPELASDAGAVFAWLVAQAVTRAEEYNDDEVEAVG
jgi:putative glutamine amidotransferase